VTNRIELVALAVFDKAITADVPPLTCNNAAGEVVPIPTLPAEVIFTF